jgi:hypothetical protein
MPQVTLVVLGAVSLAVPKGQLYDDAGAAAYLGSPGNPVTSIRVTGDLKAASHITFVMTSSLPTHSAWNGISQEHGV